MGLCRAGISRPAAVALASVGAGTASAATEQQLTHLHRPAPVASHGDIVVTSEYELAVELYRW